MPVVVFIILGIIVFMIAAFGVVTFVVENRKHSDDDENPVNTLETIARLATGDISKAVICEYTVSGGIKNEYMMLRLEYTSGEKALFRYKKKISDDEMIITGEAEAAEVMASYIPMTEEESQAVFEELGLNTDIILAGTLPCDIRIAQAAFHSSGEISVLYRTVAVAKVVSTLV